MGTIKIEAHRSIEAFRSLEKEWESLLESSSNNSIFLTWDWMSTWWDVYQDEEKELFIVTARNESGKLLCIAPLIRNRFVWKKLLLLRQIRFMGTGEAECDEVYSEYLEFIVDGEYESENVAELVFQWLLLQEGWDEIYLEQIKVGTFQQYLTSGAGDSGSYFSMQKMGESHYLPLVNNWDEQLEKMSSTQRYRVRKTIKELEKIGVLGFTRVKNRDEIDRAYKALVELHNKNWSRKGKPGVFESDKFNEFHRRMVNSLIDKQRLFLVTLTLGGTPIGVMYGFLYKNIVSVYQTGIDVEVSRTNNKIKPGMATHAMAIKEAISLGIEEYDFLIGDQGDYKAQWTSGNRPIYRIRYSKRSPKNYFISLVKKLGRGYRNFASGSNQNLPENRE